MKDLILGKYSGAAWLAAAALGLTGAVGPISARAEQGTIHGRQVAAGDDDLLGGDDLLADTPKAGDDDLLGGDAPDAAPTAEAAPETGSGSGSAILDALAAREHERLFTENDYPSAHTCKTCHPKQFREWSASPHGYAQLSVAFNAMQGTIQKQTQGSNGDFCIRCHTQVGMNIGESTFMSNMDRKPASLEGITCIVCHRMDRELGKVSGRFPIVKGDLLQPVFGPKGNAELKRVLAEPDVYRVVTEPDKPGRKIHTDAQQFSFIKASGFCGSCHDVNLLNGFRLEEAFSEYKGSPAAKRGVACHDCHMGKEQGKFLTDIDNKDANYEYGPAAVVGGVPTKDRKITSHFFAGPDYSIIHPGLFPHNSEVNEFATMREWLTFDYKAGWGTDEFEDKVPAEYVFPERWKTVDSRYDARELLNKQFELLDVYNSKRLETLRNGFGLGDVMVSKAGPSGLKFKVQAKNLTDGHPVSVGFDAERLYYLRVTVTDANGEEVFRSGHYDPNGDLLDLHSRYVHNGELPLDDQLFHLQSKFIVRMLRGGEREQVLAVNYSPNPLPYIRPSTNSTILTGFPGGARVQRNNLGPMENRWVDYKVTKKEMAGHPGPYKVNLQFRAGMIPAHLVNEIGGVGFDYDMTKMDVADALVGGHRILVEREFTIDPADLAKIEVMDITPEKGYRPDSDFVTMSYKNQALGGGDHAAHPEHAKKTGGRLFELVRK